MTNMLPLEDASNVPKIEYASVEIDLECSICYGNPVSRGPEDEMPNPVLTSCCRQTFCEECISYWRSKPNPHGESANTCPTCRARDWTWHPNLDVKMHCSLCLSTFLRAEAEHHLRTCPAVRGKCVHFGRGCDWVGTRDEFLSHQAGCAFSDEGGKAAARKIIEEDADHTKKIKKLESLLTGSDVAAGIVGNKNHYHYFSPFPTVSPVTLFGEAKALDVCLLPDEAERLVELARKQRRDEPSPPEVQREHNPAVLRQRVIANRRKRRGIADCAPVVPGLSGNQAKMRVRRPARSALKWGAPPAEEEPSFPSHVPVFDRAMVLFLRTLRDGPGRVMWFQRWELRLVCEIVEACSIPLKHEPVLLEPAYSSLFSQALSNFVVNAADFPVRPPKVPSVDTKLVKMVSACEVYCSWYLFEQNLVAQLSAKLINRSVATHSPDLEVETLPKVIQEAAGHIRGKDNEVLHEHQMKTLDDTFFTAARLFPVPASNESIVSLMPDSLLLANNFSCKETKISCTDSSRGVKQLADDLSTRSQESDNRDALLEIGTEPMKAALMKYALALGARRVFLKIFPAQSSTNAVTERTIFLPDALFLVRLRHYLSPAACGFWLDTGDDDATICCKMQTALEDSLPQMDFRGKCVYFTVNTNTDIEPVYLNNVKTALDMLSQAKTAKRVRVSLSGV
ncbi:unnamed protein product [Amoebophrya sp. A120]|nr:unnamed protein product [Amoebophrya sp. A120]|eukprot:GSA120T00002845001.1